MDLDNKVPITVVLESSGNIKSEFVKSSDPDKKYELVFEGNKISFGASGYEHYNDTTPSKLFKDSSHKSKKRLNEYFTRHKKILTSDKTPSIYKITSPGFWSAWMLWNPLSA